MRLALCQLLAACLQLHINVIYACAHFPICFGNVQKTHILRWKCGLFQTMVSENEQDVGKRGIPNWFVLVCTLNWWAIGRKNLFVQTVLYENEHFAKYCINHTWVLHAARHVLRVLLDPFYTVRSWSGLARESYGFKVKSCPLKKNLCILTKICETLPVYNLWIMNIDGLYCNDFIGFKFGFFIFISFSLFFSELFSNKSTLTV